ncbi:MAG TPA: SPOR domain-containing protein [Terriglobales bacterium]
MSPVAATRMEETTDTEITLGTGKMLALFFGLVILCAIFFGMGYSMGRSSVKTGPELLPSPSASGARSSAVNQTVTAPAPTSKAQPTEQPPAQTSSDNSSSSAPAANAASPSTTPDQSTAQPAAPGTGYFVQVAAVSKQEDAEALVEALKARQYQAFIANQPSDKLFHVQVGPFADTKDAEAMRSKLVSDGYNPILKK